MERFWAKVGVGGPDECWEWTAYRDSAGYGRLGDDRAHRVSWSLVHGPIPVGKVIMHVCDNRACVNPSHLQLGTQTENVADAMRKGRHHVGREPHPRPYVNAMAALKRTGSYTQAQLGELFGLSQTRVSQLLRAY